MTRLLAPLIVGVGFAVSSLSAQTSGTSNLGPAIIVIRHAEDAKDWAWKKDAPQSAGKRDENGKYETYPFPSEYWSSVAPDWPEYIQNFLAVDSQGNSKELNTDGFTVAAHGLSGDWETAEGTDGTAMKNASSPQGESQARRLAEKLDDFLKENGFSPVSRVITMDPRTDGSTPNTLCTLWPYLKSKNNKVELLLVERDASTDKSPGIMSLIKNEKEYGGLSAEKIPANAEKLLPADKGSTVICWTGEGMRDGDGILAKLSDNFVKSVPSWATANPARCKDIAIFYSIKDGDKTQGVVEKWTFASDTDKGGFELNATIPESAKRK